MRTRGILNLRPVEKRIRFQLGPANVLKTRFIPHPEANLPHPLSGNYLRGTLSKRAGSYPWVSNRFKIEAYSRSDSFLERDSTHP